MWLLWRLELLLLCLLSVVRVLVWNSIHIVLIWFSLLVYQWEELSIFSLYHLSHCLVQEVVGRIDWFSCTLVSGSASWSFLTIELGINGVNRWKVISHWVFICNNYVILIILLFKSTGICLRWHLSKMWLLWLVTLGVLLVTEVWRSHWFKLVLMRDLVWVNLDNNVLNMIICYVVSGIMVLIKVVICIVKIVNNLLRLPLELAVVEGIKGVLLFLRLLVIFILKLLQVLDVELSYLVLFNCLFLQFWNFASNFRIVLFYKLFIWS